MKHEYKAQLRIEEKDDPVLYEQLMNLIILAIEIADMDEKAAVEYQKKILANI